VTAEQKLMSGFAKTVFRLNGQFVSVGEELARPAGMTASWWLVLGTVLSEPRTVSDIARDVGVTRQSVQRTADLLVSRGLAEYRPNPAHRRAKLLAPREPGRAAIRRIGPAHRWYAKVLIREIGAEEAEHMLVVLRALSAVLDRIGLPSDQMLAAG
jgi:DNA-binding MarR family transcriptional regulator